MKKRAQSQSKIGGVAPRSSKAAEPIHWREATNFAAWSLTRSLGILLLVWLFSLFRVEMTRAAMAGWTVSFLESVLHPTILLLAASVLHSVKAVTCWGLSAHHFLNSDNLNAKGTQSKFGVVVFVRKVVLFYLYIGLIMPMAVGLLGESVHGMSPRYVFLYVAGVVLLMGHDANIRKRLVFGQEKELKYLSGDEALEGMVALCVSLVLSIEAVGAMQGWSTPVTILLKYL